MKNTFFLIAFFLVSFGCFSQTLSFEFANPQPIPAEFYAGSSSSGDIDGDGDQDLLMVGIGDERGVLYLNDGVGNFTEVSPYPFLFPDIPGTAVTMFQDFDNDNDLDVFYALAGSGGSGEVVQIYLNDGNANFTLLNNPALPQSVLTDAKPLDADGDGDIDLIINTFNDTVANITVDIYLNNGNAIFTPSNQTDFTPIRLGAIEVFDVENDGDIDIVISGEEAASSPSGITELYINDGNGNFSEETNSGLLDLAADDVDAGDIDNDGDLDLLTNGITNNGDIVTLLYLNNGNGLFSELNDTGLQNTFAGASNELADFDADGDLDLLITGSQAGGLPNIFNIIYENLGNNEFIEVATLGGDYIVETEVNDFNGDGLLDLHIQGFVDKTSFYWNTSEVLKIDAFSVGNPIAFPNPTYNYVTLEGIDESQKFNIFTVEGVLIQQGNLSNYNMIDFSHFSNGIYLISLENGETFRIIKK